MLIRHSAYFINILNHLGTFDVITYVIDCIELPVISLTFI